MDVAAPKEYTASRATAPRPVIKYLTMTKTFKGKYPICKLIRKGREAFEFYSDKMRFVTGQPSGNSR